jgi:hypothetical protein
MRLARVWLLATRIPLRQRLRSLRLRYSKDASEKKIYNEDLIVDLHKITDYSNYQ